MPRTRKSDSELSEAVALLQRLYQTPSTLGQLVELSRIPFERIWRFIGTDDLRSLSVSERQRLDIALRSRQCHQCRGFYIPNPTQGNGYFCSRECVSEDRKQRHLANVVVQEAKHEHE